MFSVKTELAIRSSKSVIFLCTLWPKGESDRACILTSAGIGVDLAHTVH